jgi:type IV secretory pathway component VirB8
MLITADMAGSFNYIVIENKTVVPYVTWANTDTKEYEVVKVKDGEVIISDGKIVKEVIKNDLWYLAKKVKE